VITGLPYYTQYTLSLKAYNAAGDSAASVSQSVSTIPRYPTITGATGNNLSATVTFFDGSYSGYSISNYFYKVDNSNVYPIQTVNSINNTQSKYFTVPNLHNGVTYSINVIANYTNDMSYISNTIKVVPHSEIVNALAVSPSNESLDYTLTTSSTGDYPFLKYQYSFITNEWVDISASGTTNPGLINGATIDNADYQLGTGSLFLDNQISNPSSQYFKLPSFRMSNGGLTFAFWMKSTYLPLNGSYKNLFKFETNNGGTTSTFRAYVYTTDNTNYSFNFDFDTNNQLNNQNFSMYNASELFNGQWNHVCITITQNGNYTLYVNNSYVDNADGVYPTPYLHFNNPTSQLMNTIGYGVNPATSITGNIDDFRFYNGRILSAEERSTLYYYTGGDMDLNNDPTLCMHELFDTYYYSRSAQLKFTSLTNGTEYTLYVKSKSAQEQVGLRNGNFAEETITSNGFKYI
jgi:hypothetical protein